LKKSNANSIPNYDNKYDRDDDGDDDDTMN
jgi:hypothetical protein